MLLCISITSGLVIIMNTHKPGLRDVGSVSGCLKVSVSFTVISVLLMPSKDLTFQFFTLAALIFRLVTLIYTRFERFGKNKHSCLNPISMHVRFKLFSADFGYNNTLIPDVDIFNSILY